jgi:ribonuclease Y
VIGPVLGILLGAAGALVLRWRIDRMALESARARAEELVRGAEREASNLKTAAELAARDEALEKKELIERELDEKRKEVRQELAKLDRKEEALEKKGESLTRREDEVSRATAELRKESAALAARGEELDGLVARYDRKLTSLAGITREGARQIVMDQAREEAESEAMSLLSRRLARANEEADSRAREIVVTAIQRVAVQHCAETTVSVVSLPSNDMKGRIIGREGRNIRAFEKATGVDVIVDDTPGVVVLSAFDAVRRESARRAMERLVLDGRIHPARIEDVVQATNGEMEEVIREAGEEALAEVDVHGVHPNLVVLLGRLRFRTSYGQNVLKHVIECAHLAGMIAAELGLDARLAKRAALLHDIGKAITHEVEGGHVDAAADLARRLGEPPEVVNSIESHHEDASPASPYAIITQAVDAISASRPGARRETLERYIQRMEKLEEVASSFDGVRNAYAIHAGREVRVIVNPTKISDQEALKICREIAAAVQERLTYPSEVKVTVLRETRAVEYAR